MQPDRLKQLHDLAHQGYSKRRVERELGMSCHTVRRHWPEDLKEGMVDFSDMVRELDKLDKLSVETAHGVQMPHIEAVMPEPAIEAGGAFIPDPWPCHVEPYIADTPGIWSVAADFHFPYHSKEAIEAWIKDAEREHVVGILINGDMIDFAEISDHKREPGMARVKDELRVTNQFLDYLRSRFPKQRIVYRFGNHCERLKKFLLQKAEQLEDIDEIQLESLLRLRQRSIEWVGDRRLVMLGKLPTVHGHEFAGGGGVMPARWLYLRTGESAMCGHFHQPTHYTFRTLTGKEYGLWSLGCMCYLSPLYRRFNQWRHGWATVSLDNHGNYQVRSRELLRDGKVI